MLLAYNAASCLFGVSHILSSKQADCRFGSLGRLSAFAGGDRMRKVGYFRLAFDEVSYGRRTCGITEIHKSSLPRAAAVHLASCLQSH